MVRTCVMTALLAAVVACSGGTPEPDNEGQGNDEAVTGNVDACAGVYRPGEWEVTVEADAMRLPVLAGDCVYAMNTPVFHLFDGRPASDQARPHLVIQIGDALNPVAALMAQEYLAYQVSAHFNDLNYVCMALGAVKVPVTVVRVDPIALTFEGPVNCAPVGDAEGDRFTGTVRGSYTRTP